MGGRKYVTLLVLCFHRTDYLASKCVEGGTRPLPCPETHGKEIMYKKLLSENLVPMLTESKTSIISYAGKHKEARTAAHRVMQTILKGFVQKGTKHQK